MSDLIYPPLGNPDSEDIKYPPETVYNVLGVGPAGKDGAGLTSAGGVTTGQPIPPDTELDLLGGIAGLYLYTADNPTGTGPAWLYTGSATGGSSGQITVQTGDAAGAGHQVGNLTLSVGAATGGAAAGTINITSQNNTGAGSPNAIHQQYTQNANLALGTSDIATRISADWSGTQSRGAFWGAWDTSVSPKLNAADVSGGAAFGLWGKELNITCNGPESTVWTEFDPGAIGPSLGVPPIWTGGLVIEPDIWQPTGGLGGHMQLGYAVGNSGVANNRVASPSGPHDPASATGGYIAKVYSGFHAMNNAIAPGGRGAYLGGDTTGTPALYPQAPLEARHNWNTGLRLDQATFVDNAAVTLGAGQSISWNNGTSIAKIAVSGSGANQNLTISPSGTGALVLPTLPSSDPSVANAIWASNGVLLQSGHTLPAGASDTFASGITAAGTTQGTAATITADINVVNTVAANAGVILRSGNTRRQRVLNRGANALSVYPQSGAKIETLATNAAAVVAVGGAADFFPDGSTQWWAA